MVLKNFKEKLAEIDFKTGAKKVGAAVILTAVLFGNATKAYASVPASNIIGDAQVQEDRTQIKLEEAYEIHENFTSFDKYGNPELEMDDVRKAIELSDVLNDYYFDPLYYTNTSAKEVLEVDIDGIYDKYTSATYYGKETDFIVSNLTNKPAIDAYITFSCGTVSSCIKQEISKRVYEVLASTEDEITTYPTVAINNGRLYIVVGVNNEPKVIELVGEEAKKIVTICNSLDYHYYMAINSISGQSERYESSFAYNGIDSNTNESAWLSLPDDTKKANLTTGLVTYETLQTKEAYALHVEDPTETEKLSRSEKELLSALGYTDAQIRTATKQEVQLLSMQKQYTK